MNLKGTNDREIVRVLVHCCLMEKTFNPYYAVLAKRLIEHNKGFAFTLQLCIWDMFKQLNDITPRKVLNLSKLCVYFITEGNLNLNLLKVLPFAENGGILTEGVAIFCTALVDHFLSNGNKAQVAAMFSKISDADLKVSLEAFLVRYLKDSSKNVKKSEWARNFKTAIKACDISKAFEEDG